MMVEFVLVLVAVTALLATSNTDRQVRVQRTIVQDLQTSAVCNVQKTSLPAGNLYTGSVWCGALIT